MKIVLIIQTLIIIVGAYYVYTLSVSPNKTTETKVEVVDSPTKTEPVIETKISDEIDTEVATPTEPTVGGNTDVGMEFPIPDEEPVSR